MKMVAGIDGGGTKTILEFCGLDGAFLEQRLFGPFNLNSIGKEQFQKLTEDIFQVITEAGECEAVCFGAAGISNPVVSSIIYDAAKNQGYTGKLLLKGDHEIALYGATGGKEGGILIAGTGSICTGRNLLGETARAGGWGHLVDDVGSGYSLGRDALSAVFCAYDGREKETSLTEMIMEEWSVSDIGSLIYTIYGKNDKSVIAALSQLVEKAGRMGDEAALKIIDKNGKALTELVKAVYTRLDGGKNRKFGLSLMGGLLTHDTLLRSNFLSHLTLLLPQIQIAEPVMDAAGGASLMALHEICKSE